MHRGENPTEIRKRRVSGYSLSLHSKESEESGDDHANEDDNANHGRRLIVDRELATPRAS
jgi:hypothetical protein